MASTTSKIGHGLAKGLGIKLDYRDETGNNKLSRGESVFSVTSADSYQEEEPTSAEWLASIWPSKQDTWRYIRNLFPFTHWITRYNLQWLYGDLVAGKSSCLCQLDNEAVANPHQVSLSVPSSCPRVWHMLGSRLFRSNMACTRPSWVY